MFEKSWFSEVHGTLWQVPWGPGEVEMKKNLKTLDGLDNTLPMTPHLLHLDEKNKFLEISRIPRPPRNFPKFPEIFIRQRADMVVAGGTEQKHQNHFLWSTWVPPVPQVAFCGLPVPL